MTARTQPEWNVSRRGALSAVFLARSCWAWTKPVWLVLIGWLLCRSTIADVSEVSGASMEPTLVNGNWVVINRLAYGLHMPGFAGYSLCWKTPARGEVVVLWDPVTGRRIIKRVIGLPGDELEVRGGCLLLNGEPIGPCQRHPGIGPGRVPEGHVIVLGDNRSHSRDSRTFGAVNQERIIGRVVGFF